MTELLGTAVLELVVDPTKMDRGMTAAERRAVASTDRMTASVARRMESAGASMSAAGSKFTRGVTVPLLGAAAIAGKLAVDFQASMEMIHTQAGAPQAEVDRLKGKVLDLAKVMSQSPNELAQGLFHLESIGLRGAKAMDALKVAAQGAAVGHASLEETATALGSAWLVNIKGAGDLHNVMGVLNATVGAGNMRMGELVQALGTGVLPASKIAGLGLKDVMGAMAVFTDEGYQASSAAAQFGTALHYLYDPTTKADKALKSIGMSSKQMALDMHKPNGLLVALRDLHDHLQTLPGGSKGVQAEQTLGAIFPGGRGRIMLTLLNQLDRYQMKLHQISRTSSQFGDDVKKTQETAAYQIHNTIAQLEAAGTRFGNAVLPELLSVGKTIARDAEGIAHAFSSLPKGAQDTIIKGGLLVAGIGPALKLLGVFTGGVGKLWAIEQGAQKLALGQRSLFGSAAAKGALATTNVATMQVGTLIARGMVGGIGGSIGGGVKPGPILAAGETRSTGGVILPRGVDVPVAEPLAVGESTAAGAGVMSTAGGVLSRLIGASGMALLAAPIAYGLAKAIGAALSSDSYGTTIGNHVFSHGFGGAQAPSLAKQTADALDALHRLTTLDHSNPGSRIRIQDHVGLDQLTGARLTAAEAAARKAGTLVARQLEAGWNQYKFQSEPTMLLQLRSKLKELPPAAQASAVSSAVKFSEGLERQGRLAKGSTARMLSSVEAQFPGFERYLGLSGNAGIKQFNRAMDLSQARDKLKRQIHAISQDFVTVQDAVSKTSDTAEAKTAATVKALLRIQSNGTGPARRLATRDLARLRDAVANDMDKASGSVTSWMKQMSYELGPNLLGASKTAAGHLSAFTGHIVDAMSNGSLATGQGMNLIIKTLNQALKEMGQKQLSPVQVAAVTLGVGKTNQLTHRGAASGALMQIGRPGEAGRDTVPLNVGGTPIMVAPGEQVAVFNRHQLPIVNAALGPMGGLPGLFSSVRRPNYMASGGIVRGFAGGGTVPYSGLEGLWDKAGGPASMAALMAAIAEAESGGNPSARNPSGASGLWQILGLPFPGNPFDPLTNARMALAKFRSQGLGAWVTYTSGAYRQYLHGGVPASMTGLLGAMQSVHAPGVKGSGVIATLVRAALGKAAGAANSYESAHMPSGGSGSAAPIGGLPGGVGVYDGRPVDKWIIPILRWAAAHGWAGSVNSGYRTPAQQLAAAEGYGLSHYGPGGPLGSNHVKANYPGGAVDVTDPAQLAAVLRGYPGRPNLVWGGPVMGDPVHFSADGHSRGGLIRGLASGGLLAGNPFAANARTARVTPHHHRRHRAANHPLTGWGLGGLGTPQSGASGAVWGASGGQGDLAPINQTLRNILNLDGGQGGSLGGGHAQTLSDKINWFTNYWQSGLFTDPNFSAWQAPADFVLSTDAAGNQVAPFLSPHLGQVASELHDATEWQSEWVRDLTMAARLSQELLPLVRQAIETRRKHAAAIRAKIEANLRAIRTLQGQVKSERKKKHPDHGLIDGWNRQIGALETENARLGGSRLSVGTGGELGAVTSELGSPAATDPLGTVLGSGSGASGLYQLQDTVKGWVTQLTGVGGDIPTQQLQLKLYTQGLAGLVPGAQQALLAAQQGSTSPVTAQLNTDLLSEHQQDRDRLAVSQKQYEAITLPPFGGSFYHGGVVPGAPGEPRTIIAHGGEKFLGVGNSSGGSDVHVHIDRRSDLAQLIDVRVEKVTRSQTRQAAPGGRPLPGARAGQLARR